MTSCDGRAGRSRPRCVAAVLAIASMTLILDPGRSRMCGRGEGKVLVVGVAERAEAAAEVAWTDPIAVWESETRVASPALVTDASGRSHLFFADGLEVAGTTALYHAFVEGVVGADPIDVAIIGGQFSVAADRSGDVHVVYMDSRGLMYMRAPATEAHDPRAWSRATRIGEAPSGRPSLAIGDDNRLHACSPQYGTLEHLVSESHGDEWEDANSIAQAVDSGDEVGYVACAIDARGELHAVWNELAPPDFYPPGALRYASSADGGATWSDPYSLRDGSYTLPTLVGDSEGRVHLVLQGAAGTGGRYYQWREAGTGPADGWSSVDELIPAGQGGMDGDAPLAVDGDGGLHVVTVAEGLQWVHGQPGAWAAPTLLVDDSEVLRTEGRNSGIGWPAMTVSAGNMIHVAFEVDFGRVYYLSGIGAGGATEPQFAPVETATSSAVGAAPVASATAWATNEAISAAEAGTYVRSLDDSPMAGGSWSVVVGPALSMILVGIVLARRMRRR